MFYWKEYGVLQEGCSRAKCSGWGEIQKAMLLCTRTRYRNINTLMYYLFHGRNNPCITRICVPFVFCWTWQQSWKSCEVIAKHQDISIYCFSGLSNWSEYSLGSHLSTCKLSSKKRCYAIAEFAYGMSSSCVCCCRLSACIYRMPDPSPVHVLSRLYEVRKSPS